LTAAKANGRSWACSFANEHLYAGFPHLYWAGTPLPRRFVEAAVLNHQKEQTP
jgi:cobyrinic acid a,c-diamide synthase